MDFDKAAFAAVKAITKLKADIQKTYKLQRRAEDASAMLTIASPKCRIENFTVTARDGYEIPVRLFTPLDIEFSPKAGLHVDEDFKGTILFFHGGGWANGDIDFYTDSCMKTALKLNRRVLSVDYRRSPEHKFPYAIDDCYDVAKKLFAKEILPDVDTDNIVLFGDSAGGNIAAVVSLKARDEGIFKPKTQMLLYPLTYNDHTEQTIFPSVVENGSDYLLTREEIQGYVEMYLGKADDYTNPYFAPLLMNDLSDQPRTLVISAEFCPLRDEGETYAARLESEGAEVNCYRIKNGVHGYFLYPSVLSLVRDTYSIIENFLDGTELPQEDEDKWLALIGTD